jgi:anhydro-N-acetylmuramic acid kinase
MRVIGLMSGTSIDGIDAALVEIIGSTEDLQATLIAGETYSYPANLRDRILAVCSGAALSIAELATLDDDIAEQFAQAALRIQANQTPAVLIGSHGQTVFHRPPANRLGYSLQLGRGATIAHRTQIVTISNFRAADTAIGGQGAPLVPPIDAALLRDPIEHRCVQNIGGIGNVTYLSPAKSKLPIRGWDTGPGNMLIDLAVARFSEQTYDRDGVWAASGTPNQTLVDRWLQQDFFQQPPPKSTGREQFGSDYLAACLSDCGDLSAADILATLTEFTAASIAQSYQTFLPQLPDRVFLCGGGSRNPYLKSRIQALLPDSIVTTTDEAGLNADFKEAIAFAILAYWRYHDLPGNLPEVTGAPKSVLLGEIYHVG